MKHLIIGTAGHVDHGKTLLVKALTGVDTDRLAEEKARGLTIEPGFAPLSLSKEIEASVIDVPGHERFFKNMLAGISGVDIALLVVAADEGVKPQTIEHLEILSLLAVKAGLVVFTRCDLADDTRLAKTQQEITALVSGSFLQHSPRLTVSARTGQGIDSLRATLTALAGEVSAKDVTSPVRLPVDRVFTVAGFGTVVTGTLLAGTLRVGDLVSLCPSGLQTRARGLQVHGSPVAAAYAGQRVAVNLSGVSKAAISRGEMLYQPGLHDPATVLDVRLSLLSGAHAVRSGTRLHLYHGAKTVLCRAYPLAGHPLAAGESGYAQLRLEQPMALLSGDRLVVRFYSPQQTVGSAVVLDASAPRHKPNDPQVIADLAAREQDDPAARMLLRLAVLRPWAEVPPALSLSPTQAATLRDELTLRGALVPFSADRWLTTAAYQMLCDKALDRLQVLHAAHPMQECIPLAQVNMPGLSPADCAALFRRMAQQRQVCFTADRVSLPQMTPRYTPRCQKLLTQLNALFDASPFSPPAPAILEKTFAQDKRELSALLQAMRADGRLVEITPQMLFRQEALAAAEKELLALFGTSETISLAQLRDRLQTSRKYAQALLEYWDRIGRTVRQEDMHRLVKDTFPDKLHSIWE